MDLSFLKGLGQVAGLGGIAVGIFLLIFREVVRKKVFPNLTKSQGHQILVLILVLTWSVAIFGISAWAYVAVRQGSGPEVMRTHVGKVLDEETRSPVKGAKVILGLGGVPKTGYTDAEGVYRFPVPTGNLSDPYIQVLAKGYEPYDRKLTLEALAEAQDIRITPVSSPPAMTVLERQILLTAGKSALYQVTPWWAEDNKMGLPRPHLLAAVIALIDNKLVSSSYDYREFTSLLESVRNHATFINDGVNHTIYSVINVSPEDVKQLASFQLTPSETGRNLITKD